MANTLCDVARADQMLAAEAATAVIIGRRSSGAPDSDMGASKRLGTGAEAQARVDAVPPPDLADRPDTGNLATVTAEDDIPLRLLDHGGLGARPALRARREWQRGQPSVESVMRVPPGVIDGVLGTGAEVGEAILRAPQMRRVTFTGAVRVGRAIGGNAADRIIPMTQELGGTSEDNVFEDADLPSAAVEALNGYCRNADQVGSAGWRIRVQRSTQADFVAAMAETMAAVVPGDTLGPLTPPRSSGSCRSMSRRPRPTAPGWWRGAPWRM